MCGFCTYNQNVQLQNHHRHKLVGLRDSRTGREGCSRSWIRATRGERKGVRLRSESRTETRGPRRTAAGRGAPRRAA